MAEAGAGGPSDTADAVGAENDDKSVITGIQREMRSLLRDYLDGLARIDECSVEEDQGATDALNAEVQALGQRMRDGFAAMNAMARDIPGRERTIEAQRARIEALKEEDAALATELREEIAKAEQLHQRSAALADAITDIALAQDV